MMQKALSSSETSILTRATRHNVTEDALLQDFLFQLLPPPPPTRKPNGKEGIEVNVHPTRHESTLMYASLVNKAQRWHWTKNISVLITHESPFIYRSLANASQQLELVPVANRTCNFYKPRSVPQRTNSRSIAYPYQSGRKIFKYMMTRRHVIA
jgi:hypothetical protein